jgi:GTP pyrophosphokinase
VIWAEDIQRSFDVAIRVDVRNAKGVLARIAGTLTSADANIAHVAMDDRFSESAVGIRFVIQVESRYHLAKVMRRLRQNQDVLKITRVFGK